MVVTASVYFLLYHEAIICVCRAYEQVFLILNIIFFIIARLAYGHFWRQNYLFVQWRCAMCVA